MAKLTNKQRRVIEIALDHLNRANKFITTDNIAIARKGSFASTTLHYARADGSTLYEVEKAYGSDLTGLQAGIETLNSFLSE